MNVRALPVYLKPEQYEAVKEAAGRTGASMTELIRALIDEHLLSDLPPTDLTPLIGTADIGRPTDIANEKAEMLDEALRVIC